MAEKQNIVIGIDDHSTNPECKRKMKIWRDLNKKEVKNNTSSLNKNIDNTSPSYTQVRIKINVSESSSSTNLRRHVNKISKNASSYTQARMNNPDSQSSSSTILTTHVDKKSNQRFSKGNISLGITLKLVPCYNEIT